MVRTSSNDNQTFPGVLLTLRSFLAGIWDTHGVYVVFFLIVLMMMVLVFMGFLRLTMYRAKKRYANWGKSMDVLDMYSKPDLTLEGKTLSK
jgi:hypothetical protein